MENKSITCEVVNEIKDGEVLELKNPIMINGEQVTFIKYDTKNLTGGSVEKAIKELAKRKIAVAVPEIDVLLHCQLFADASNLDYTDIQRLSMSDYLKATSIIRDFFID